MMTVEYRDYFLGKLQEMFNEWAADKEGTPNVASKKIASFEDKYMKNITGQLPVRQELFRIFVRELADAISILETVDDELSETSEHAIANKTVTCALKEITARLEEYSEITAEDVEMLFAGYECYFTGLQKSNDFYSISGNYSSNKGSFTAPNGQTYTDCLKIETNTKISFTIVNPMVLYMGFDKEIPNIKVDGVKITGTNYVIEYVLRAGSHVLTKADANNLYYINLI